MARGKLFWNDTGHLLQNRNEEIAHNSWIRKTIALDYPEDAAVKSSLALFLYEYEGNEEPLVVEINGRARRLEPDPALQGVYSWKEIPVGREELRRGPNEVTLRSANYAYNGWMIGVDNGNRAGTSAKSSDQGRTWSGERLGYDYSLTGEYIMRWYVEGAGESAGDDSLFPDTPIVFALQPPDHPDLRVFREMERLDDLLAGAQSDYEKGVRLCSWTASQWVHASGAVYPPFHFPTLLDWKRKGRGHGVRDVRGFCVHFANLFAQACWAVGLAARGVVLKTNVLHLGSGHFVAELYCRELGKWVMFDADYDVQVRHEGVPLNVLDVHDRWLGGRHGELEFVKGRSFGGNPLGFGYFVSHLEDGGYETFAIPRLQDYISHPQHQMVSHGTITYYEPELVWFDESLALRTAFPFVTDRRDILYYDPTGGESDADRLSHASA